MATQSLLLPPGSAALQRALEQVTSELLDVPVEIRSVWNPQTCPIALLPWLAWGLSVDLWDANWSEQMKRDAVADAIAFHRRKGTPASLRTVLDRFDPLIDIVEWFDDPVNLTPFTFRLELPMAADSGVDYSPELVAHILRDIASVKPVRARMTAVHRLRAQAEAWLTSAAAIAGFERINAAADLDSATDEAWLNYLQTEDGEPILAEDGSFLEVA